MSDIVSKLIKQIEYYFDDVNLAKDKHLNQLISSSNDGWVSYEELLKFPRLKAISDDKEAIQAAISNSESKIVEANENGIRRFPDLAKPLDLQTVADMHLDKSLYIKGFNTDETIDEIIEFLEKCGGPTMNVHMRRVPKSKLFKGSVFAIFKVKEDAEKFLSNDEAAEFKKCEIIRMMQSDYNTSKKNQYTERNNEKEQRQKSMSANREALLETKMTKGALIELSGLEKSIEGDNVEKGDFCDDRDTRSATKVLKTVLTEFLAEVAPVLWVEHFPSTGKIIIRLGKENSAEDALKKLTESDDGLYKYQVYAMNVSVLTGEAEKDYWRNILVAQSNRNNNNKRGGRSFGGPDRKRMRR